MTSRKSIGLALLMVLLGVGALQIAGSRDQLPEEPTLEREPALDHPIAEPELVAGSDVVRAALVEEPRSDLLRVKVFTVEDLAKRTIAPRIAFSLSIETWQRGRATLLEGTTDDDGRALVKLHWDEIVANAWSKAAVLWATCREFGFQEQAVQIRLKDNVSNAAVEITLPAQRGATLRGMLLDPEGKPASGVLRVYAEDSSMPWLPDFEQYISLNGIIQCHFKGDPSELGGIYQLCASGNSGPLRRPWRDYGTASLGPLALDFSRPLAPMTLQLSGPGSLLGQVLTSSGEIAPELEILALIESADVGAGGLAIPEEIFRMHREDGRGHVWQTAWTDSAGLFVLHGLRNDRFHLYARSGNEAFSGYGFPHRLTSEALPIGAGFQTLRFDRPHLVVSLSDNPESTAKPDLVWKGWAGQADGSWPKVPCVLVLPIPEDSTRFRSFELNVEGKSLNPGEVVFDLLARREYWVTLLMPDQPIQRQRIALGADATRVEHNFVLAGSVGSGSLEVSVYSPCGAEVMQNVRLSINDPVSGIQLVERSRFYGDWTEHWPAQFDLPAGDYELVVENIPSLSGRHGQLQASRSHGEFRSQIQIAAGSKKVVEARLGATARIHLTLNGSAVPQDYLVPTYFRFDDPRKARASVRLWRPGSYAIGVPFARYAMQGTSAAGTHLVNDLELGTSAISEPLVPGTYRLEVELLGGRRAERQIELVEGQTLPVSFDLGSE